MSVAASGAGAEFYRFPQLAGEVRVARHMMFIYAPGFTYMSMIPITSSAACVLWYML